MNNDIPLTMAPQGKRLQVTAIQAGKGLTRRLIELGFSENANVSVVRSQPSGSLIVQVNDSRFALGRGMAMKILVRVVEQNGTN